MQGFEPFGSVEANLAIKSEFSKLTGALPAISTSRQAAAVLLVTGLEAADR